MGMASIGLGGGTYTGPPGPYIGSVPMVVATPDLGNTGASTRSAVYGKPVQLSCGVRALTGYPIWAGNYAIPGGNQVSAHALAGVNYVPPAALLNAWPNAINAFAISFGYQLPPLAERNTLKVRQIFANGVKIYSAAPAQASGVLTATANFANGETVTIGGAAYTFQATLTNVSGNVKIAATLALSLINLQNAINRDGTNGVPNTDFAAATPQHPTVYAFAEAVRLVVTARTAGTAGNSIGTTETCAAAAFGAATLTGGTDTDTVTKVGDFTFTLYQGSPTQTADPIIAADRGNLTPGFRDLIYIVFSNFKAGSIAGTDPYMIPTITVEFSEASFTLANVLRYLALNAGYASSAISVDAALTDTITGVVISDRYDADQLFDDLGLVYGFKHFESEGFIKFVKDATASASPVYALTRDDLGDVGDGFALDTSIDAPADSPYSLQVSYLNNTLYAWEAATFTMDGQVLQLDAAADKQLKIPFVLAAGDANQKAARAWFALDSMTVQQSFILPYRFLRVEPSDALTLSVGDYTYKVQIGEMQINGDLSLSITASNFDFNRDVPVSAIADFPAPLSAPSGVLPGSETHDGPSTSGDFTVPLYNTLEIEGWGAGAGSGIAVNCTNAQTGGQTAATDGGDTVVTYSGVLVAYGGKFGANVTADSDSSVLGKQSIGGIAAGGDINSFGTNGGAPQRNAAYAAGNGYGGGSPNGGATVTITGIAEPAGANVVDAGDAGNAPGGGASGAACTMQIDDANRNVGGGGSGGGYFKITFTIGEPGAPIPGDLVHWVIGASGAGGNFTSLSAGNGARGAAGAAGRVKFTWA